MVSDFLSNIEMASLVEAIQQAEEGTSGEIRIHIDSHTKENFAQEAIETFYKLNMDKTVNRNAVLFYVSFQEKYLTVIGDEGINNKVPQSFWDSLHDEITKGFSEKKFFSSLKEAVIKTGIKLRKDFPQGYNNYNELPNEISLS